MPHRSRSAWCRLFSLCALSSKYCELPSISAPRPLSVHIHTETAQHHDSTKSLRSGVIATPHPSNPAKQELPAEPYCCPARQRLVINLGGKLSTRRTYVRTYYVRMYVRTRCRAIRDTNDVGIGANTPVVEMKGRDGACCQGEKAKRASKPSQTRRFLTELITCGNHHHQGHMTYSIQERGVCANVCGKQKKHTGMTYSIHERAICANVCGKQKKKHVGVFFCRSYSLLVHLDWKGAGHGSCKKCSPPGK